MSAYAFDPYLEYRTSVFPYYPYAYPSTSLSPYYGSSLYPTRELSTSLDSDRMPSSWSYESRHYRRPRNRRYSTQELSTSHISDGTYFGLNGMLARSDEIGNYYRRRTPNSWYSRERPSSQVSNRMYFNLNGKLASSNKIRDYRKAQRHVLDLYPDALRGIASSRIQFYVMQRPGERYTHFRSYISKHAWEAEMDSWKVLDTVGIEVRKSVSESVSSFLSSFFNRAKSKLF